MTVTVNATATAAVSSGSVTTLTNSNLTAAAGITAGLAWVLFGNPTATPTGVAVTWGGVAMTLLASIANTTTNFALATLWGVLTSTTGAQSVVATWTGSSSCVIDAVAFAGTATDTVAHAFLNANTATGSSATATVTASSATGNVNVAGTCCVTQNVNSISATGSTAVFTLNSNIGAGGARATGAASVAWSAPLAASAPWAMACVDVAVPYVAGSYVLYMHFPP